MTGCIVEFGSMNRRGDIEEFLGIFGSVVFGPFGFPNFGRFDGDNVDGDVGCVNFFNGFGLERID